MLKIKWEYVVKKKKKQMSLKVNLEGELNWTILVMNSIAEGLVVRSEYARRRIKPNIILYTNTTCTPVSFSFL